MKLKTLLGILALVAVSALAIDLIFFDKGPQPAVFKASTNVVEVTDQNFEQEILNSKIPVVIEFNATWCGPCKQYTPIFHKVADQYVGKIKFVSIDVDKAPNVAALLGLKAIPFTLFLSESNDVISGAAAAGAITEDQLKQMLDTCMKPGAKLVQIFQKKAIDGTDPKGNGTTPKTETPKIDAPKDAPEPKK
jgi:thioredoxin 1